MLLVSSAHLVVSSGLRRGAVPTRTANAEDARDFPASAECCSGTVTEQPCAAHEPSMAGGVRARWIDGCSMVGARRALLCKLAQGLPAPPGIAPGDDTANPEALESALA